jgi:hypothetical protein
MAFATLDQTVRAGSFVGSVTGQAVAWNKVHQTNKKSDFGFFHRMGRHAGYNIIGGVGGSVAGTALAAAGFLGYHALRRK